MTGLSATNVFAQRSGRGGGGGGGGRSSFHGSMGGGMSRGFSGGGRSTNISRSSGTVRSNTTIVAGGRFGRGGYRPGHGGYYRGGWGYRRPYYGYYSFYRPYLGLSLSILPYGYYPFYFGADQFYYSGGFFYRQYDNEYKVVVPPVGAQVPSIPSDATEVTINGQTYYEYKGVYYSISQDSNGKTVYVVAGKDGVLDTANGANGNNGAATLPQVGDVVDQLPDGSRDVMIKGQKYYVSEDGVYYEQVVDGDKVTYKVIGIGN